MEANPGIAALRQLSHLGYRFTVIGESIKARYEGPGDPDPAQVRPLLGMVKEHKESVRCFLRCYCPRCGGVATCPDYEGKPLCLACDWSELAKIYPAMAGVKH